MNILIIPILTGTHIPKKLEEDMFKITKYQPYTVTLQLMSDPEEQKQLTQAALDKVQPGAVLSPFLELITAQFGGWVMPYVFMVDAMKRMLPPNQGNVI